jgi:hypothetical protein
VFKKELSFTIFIFVILEFITVTNSLLLFLSLGWIGLLILLIWIVLSLAQFAKDKETKFSDLLVKFKLKNRWYQYVFTPSLFYISLIGFIFFVKHPFLQQFIIFLGSTVLFVLFMNIKSSYNKSFYIEKSSRVVFDMVNLLMFYIVAEILTLSGALHSNITALLFGSLTTIILLSSLKVKERVSWSGLFVSILSGIFIGVFAFFIKYNQPHLFSFLLTLGFYLILSIWHLRLSGERKIVNYLPPFMFVIMSVTIALS